MTIEIKQLVCQGESPVCGQACIAMLTNKGLADVVASKAGRTGHKHLKDLLLKHGGLKSYLRNFKALPSLEECWIVAVKRHRNAEKKDPTPQGEDWWHWIVVANENRDCYVLDASAGTERGPICQDIKRKVVEMTTEIVTVDKGGGVENYTPRKGKSLCILARIASIASNS
jgi:hypothetical protein